MTCFRWEQKKDNGHTQPLGFYKGKREWAGDSDQGDCSIRIFNAEYDYDNGRYICQAELQRRSSKILPGQRPLSKRFLSSDALFTVLPSIIDSLASPPPQASKLICNDHRSNTLTYIRHLVSIGPDNTPSV